MFKLVNNPNFNREKLPNPYQYYDQQELELRGYGEWKYTLCPFHDDRRPSFSINMETGGYRCFGCDNKGGDIIDFHRKKYDLSFVEAIKDLGAWEE